MTNKEYILKLLNVLKSGWDLADPLISLVKKDAFDDNIINIITDVFKNAVRTVSDKLKKEKFQKGLEIMQKIKSQEELENKKKEQELFDIENELENL